ncbi:IMP dehydrogenase [candidate division WOR-3 bacterium]|nr:IMP dehydrogenase [candidate division WOR-3 bacterium]
MKEALTFDDVLLVPQRSFVLPAEVDISSRFSKGITLHLPLVSAAMDTVTEAKMAIAMARAGGIGVIHKNMTIEQQAAEVAKVKRAESSMIANPFSITPERTVAEVRELFARYNISGLPVVDEEGRLIGIVTRRDLLFEDDGAKPVREVMTSERLVTAPEGTGFKRAKEILKKNRLEKLPIVDRQGRLKGLITAKDILKRVEHPYATVDSKHRLRCAAAVGTGKEALERARALVAAEVDAIVIDTAHGHQSRVLETAKKLRRLFPGLEIVAGNVATAEGAIALAKCGVSAVKVGIGPGSICTTRVVAGVGVPQLSAIMECAQALRRYRIPLIADGGIRFSGDVAKALAAGASSVMMGNLLAGTDESPGEDVLLEGRRYKVYRGMGSIDAMRRGSAERYFQESGVELVPQGIVGRVPYRGSVRDVLFQLEGGVRASMGFCGARTIADFQKRAKFVRITNAGLRESHPHSVTIIKEAPNYEVPPEEHLD